MSSSVRAARAREGFGTNDAGQRGAEFLRQYGERTGQTIRGQRLWTDHEVEVVVRCYPDYDAMLAQLPHRTRKALELKAAKLGITRNRSVWTALGVAQLRKPYIEGVAPRGLLVQFAGKTMRQIYARASKSGFRRPRRPPKSTGVAIVDAIRLRAWELRFTMTELDAETGGGRYFIDPRHLNWKKIELALRLLEGELAVSWRE